MSTEPIDRPAVRPPELPLDPVLHAPREVVELRRGDIRVLLDPDRPHWVATDRRGAEILLAFRGGARPDEVARRLAEREGIPVVTARLRVDAVARDARRCGFLAEEPPVPLPHLGRETLLPEGRLEEFWVHLNDACNLACRHCLVSSGPGGDPGLPGETITAALREAAELGARTFCFTGGEPLLRDDFPRLAAVALEPAGAELAVLTNGLLLVDGTIEGWRRAGLDLARLRLQVSLDGSCPAVNDPLRGPGSFERIVAGIRAAVAAGLRVTVTTTVTRANLADVPRVTRLAGELGVAAHHLLWPHRRGRAAGDDPAPDPAELLAAVRAAREAGEDARVTVDNVAAVCARVNHEPGTRRDLASAAVTCLCLHRDGGIWPSASLVGIPELRLGVFGERSLADLLRESPVARRFRRASLVHKADCPACPVRFLCGGGDIEHAFLRGGALEAMDPWCSLHRGMIEDALLDRAEERDRFAAGAEAGWTDPWLRTWMGEGAHACGEEAPGTTRLVVSSSECVLSFELDATRRIVREFYGNAAEHPEEDLCCPVRPRPTDIEHIPPEVVERFYGCGSPVIQADPRPGEVTLDLGSGAGIDVFICARRVGPSGRALGVDMTDRMLAVAEEARRRVAENLGYDNVEFRRGFLEDLPVADASVDLVTSNCVINLSPDKRRVFREIWRVLRNGGRFVVSDIVAEREVPAAKRQDPRLWGQCISGALTEEEFLSALERAGFHGIEILEKFPWREVDGYRFFSVTVRGWRHDRREVDGERGEVAVYLGPHRAVCDEQGIFYPRGVPVPVDAATADRLRRPPYAGHFQVGEVAPRPDCGCRNC